MHNPYLRAALREQDSLRPKGPRDYDELKVAELKAEIVRRNVDRETPLSSAGKKDELIAVLVADDTTQTPAPQGDEEEAAESAAQSDNTTTPKE